METQIRSRVVKKPEICGGSPTIEGTRIRIMDIVEEYEFLGTPPEEIAEEFGISLAQVFSALAYYHENREEIQEEIKGHKEFVKKLMHG